MGIGAINNNEGWGGWNVQKSQKAPSLAGIIEATPMPPIGGGEDDEKNKRSGELGRPRTGGGIGTYDALGQIRPSDAKVDTVAELANLRASGQELDPEAKALLSAADSPKALIEGLSKATGKSEAQIMASLINMSGAEAAALGKQLEGLTGVPAASYADSLSKLTGHAEAMLRRSLMKSEDEEDEDGKRPAEQAELQRQMEAEADLKNFKIAIDVLV